MNKSLLDLSGKVDDLTVDLFEHIVQVTKSLNIPFFVVGAAARDMILMRFYDINTIRITMDIDLSIKISDWDQCTKLMKGLEATGQFTLTSNIQRLLYKDTVPIDIVPFGTIAGHDGFVSWPPEHSRKMNVLGFEDAHSHSIAIRLRSNPVLDIQFASLTGLAIMKILSWNDSYPVRDKDAKDLALILEQYTQAGNEDRLLNEETDLVESEDFDYVRAGARLLGRDIVAMSQRETTETILEILNRETGEQAQYRLVSDMMAIGRVFDDEFDKKLELLEELKTGILERL